MTKEEVIKLHVVYMDKSFLRILEMAGDSLNLNMQATVHSVNNEVDNMPVDPLATPRSTLVGFVVIFLFWVIV